MFVCSTCAKVSLIVTKEGVQRSREGRRSKRSVLELPVTRREHKDLQFMLLVKDSLAGKLPSHIGNGLQFGTKWNNKYSTPSVILEIKGERKFY